MNFAKLTPVAVVLALLGSLTLLTFSAVPVAAQTYFFNTGSFGTGHNPQGVASGDLNGDGRLDIVVANFNDNTVSVLLRNSNGSYQPKVDYATGSNPIAVGIGDVNGDEKQDLIVVNNNCPTTPCTAVGSISALLGNGDGTFLAHIDSNVGNSPNSLVVSDFNGDGKQDAVVVNGQDNTA